MILGQDKLNNLQKDSATTLSLPGDNILTIMSDQRLFQNKSVNFGINGLGGLDVGAIAADTIYYIYAVLTSGSLGLVASVNPLGPSGFLVYKELGKLKTDSTPEIDELIMKGNSEFTRIQTGSINQAQSALLSLSSFRFNLATATINKQGADLINLVDNANGTRFTSKQDGNITMSYRGDASTTNHAPRFYHSVRGQLMTATQAHSSSWTHGTGQSEILKDEYVYLPMNGTLGGSDNAMVTWKMTVKRNYENYFI